MTDVSFLRWFTPRAATFLVLLLAVVLVADVWFAATHKRQPIETRIDPCALTLTANGQECR